MNLSNAYAGLGPAGAAQAPAGPVAAKPKKRQPGGYADLGAGPAAAPAAGVPTPAGKNHMNGGAAPAGGPVASGASPVPYAPPTPAWAKPPAPTPAATAQVASAAAAAAPPPPAATDAAKAKKTPAPATAEAAPADAGTEALPPLDWAHLPSNPADLAQQLAAMGLNGKQIKQAMALAQTANKFGNVTDWSQSHDAARMAARMQHLAGRVGAATGQTVDPYSIGFGPAEAAGTPTTDDTTTTAGPGTTTTVNDDGSIDLGQVDPNAPKENWMFSKDPEMAQVQMQWEGYQEARGDRQAAIDTYQKYLDSLDTDPTRTAAYDFLGNGPNYTFSQDDLDRMKAGNAETYGDTVDSAMSSAREQAAALGVPVTDLTSQMAEARVGAGRSLASADRNMDIEYARQRNADLQQYYQNLLNAQSGLVGAKGSAYGSMAGLISGAPGLASTGNPMSGVAQYRLDEAAANPKTAWNAQDYVTLGMQGAGMAMKAFAL